LHFGATDPDLPLFLLHLRTAHLLSPLKTWQLWIPKSYQVFMEPPYIIVTPYLSIDHFLSYFPKKIGENDVIGAQAAWRQNIKKKNKFLNYFAMFSTTRG
jgi:hypothetical protein